MGLGAFESDPPTKISWRRPCVWAHFFWSLGQHVNHHSYVISASWPEQFVNFSFRSVYFVRMKLQFCTIPYSPTIGHGNRSVRLLWISDPVRPCFLAITSSDLAQLVPNLHTLHFSPSADFYQYGLLTKNQWLGYLSLPRNVNLIYYPDGGCTRRPAGLDGSAGQPRWVQPSLTPPTGRDPLGSRLSVVGRERDEDGGAAEAGVLMRGWRIYAWTGVVIDCALCNDSNWSRLADT